MTGSLEEMDQFRLNWVESNVFALGTAPTRTSAPDRWDPTQGGASAGSVMFYFLFKKKKEEEAEAKIAKCQHWSNLYGMHTEDLLLAVLLCTFEIF